MLVVEPPPAVPLAIGTSKPGGGSGVLMVMLLVAVLVVGGDVGVMVVVARVNCKQSARFLQPH